MIPVVLLIFLLLFPAVSIEGARQGLLLWSNVVLPTLAPFMICTQLVTLLDGIRFLMIPFSPILRVLFGLSPSGGYVLLAGLLCGYPLGARLCAEFASRDLISQKEARYLLSICNHPSPMFLLGFVKGQLPADTSAFLLLTCLYLPILPLSLISRYVYGFTAKFQTADSDLANTKKGTFSMEEILLSTCDTLVVIGGYIMLFSILAAWIKKLPFLPNAAKALLSGIAEITTGVYQICSCPTFLSPLLPVIAIVAFGGFSGIFQTRSVICCKEEGAKNAGLSIRHYLVWKLLHAFLSCITLILLVQTPLP